MKIAITGGAGFIATRLAALLKEAGHSLVLIDLKKSEAYPQDSIIGDVCDKAAMISATKGCDAIYHLAAEHRDDVSPLQRYYDVNVAGGENVLAAATENDVKKVIFSSSVAVYPLEPESVEEGSSEDYAPAPFNDYGQSKLDSEHTFKAWAEEDSSRSVFIMRLCATFGPGNRGNIFTLMNQIAGGKFIMIGDGSNKKSIAYVGNVAAFLVDALGHENGVHIYNYADKPDLNMREFVTSVREALGQKGAGPQLPYIFGLLGGTVFDIAAKITGRKFPISSIRVKKFCANTVVNAQKVESSGFKRPHSLQDGITEMITAEFHGRSSDIKKAA